MDVSLRCFPALLLGPNRSDALRARLPSPPAFAERMRRRPVLAASGGQRPTYFSGSEDEAAMLQRIWHVSLSVI